MARENSILLGGYNRLLVYFLVFFIRRRSDVISLRETPVIMYTSITEQDRKLFQCS